MSVGIDTRGCYAMNAPTRMMLDASANGTLLDKSLEEAFDILDRIANNDILDLDASDSVSAQLSAITNMQKNLQKPTDFRDAKALSCVHCEGNHHANDSPTMHESASYVGNYNRNTNMTWQSEAKGNASTSHNNLMEAMIQEFISSTKTLLLDHSTTIKSQGNLLQTQGALLQSHDSSLRALENQVGQIAQALQVRPQGSLPSDTQVTKRNGKEQCSALTLRSGTTINKNVEFRGEENTEASPVSRQKESEVQQEAQEEEGREEVLTTNPSGGQSVDAAAKSVTTQTTEDVRPPPPFPQRLKNHIEDNQFKKFMDMLDQLHIDVPFLEAIGQMPTYAKFLKVIITKKRKIERFETVATAGEYFLGDIPPKKNDPGKFIIPCSIGDNFWDIIRKK
ncbi:hypothetical protein GQ457_09G016850 [Hibiscus cannabinus]